MSLTLRLHQHALNQPESLAVAHPAGSISFAELHTAVQEAAQALSAGNVSSDSVVGIHHHSDTQHLIDCLAVDAIGATAFTLAAHDTAAQHEALLQHCSATHEVSNANVVSTLHTNTAGEHTTDALHLFATSGTTGKPKLVIQTSEALVAQAPRHVETNSRFLCLAGMEHNFARRHRLYCVAMGATNVFVDASESIVQQCLAFEADVLHVSAFQAQELLGLEDCAALSGIKLKLGGSHVSSNIRDQLKQRITPTLHAGYGTTETGAIAFTDPHDSNAGETVGKALPGLDIRILSTGGNAAAPDEEGEITIRSDGLFKGYLGQPDLTASRLKEGWFYTGDIGKLDSEGRLTVCGRADDMFVFNSMNIFPQDLEASLVQHPEVVDAAVTAKRSEVHGDIPVALLVTNPNADLRGIKRFIREQAGARCPRQFVHVENIPRNAAGKIERTKLAEMLL